MRPRDENKVTKAFEAALQIIGQKGIAGLKMQELARASGMATGTLYIYFKDKNDLLHQMYLHYVGQMHRIIWGEVTHQADYPLRFRQKWYNYVRFVQQFPAEMIFMEQYHRSPYVSETAVHQGDSLLQPLIDVIEEGQQLGYLQTIPAHLILAYLCGSVQEIVAWSEDGSLPPVTDILHWAWEMTWRAVSK